MDNEFKDIILNLEKLNEVKADRKLIGRFENLLIPSLQKRTHFSALLQFKFLPLLFLFLALGSTLVIASENSQPGELLYPVKAAIFRIRPQASISPTPTPLPAASVLPSPSQSPEVKGQSIQVHINPQAVVTPSPLASVSVSGTVTPTPSPSTNPTSTPQANLEVQLPAASATISVGTQLPEVTKEPILNLDVSLNDKKILNIGL